MVLNYSVVRSFSSGLLLLIQSNGFGFRVGDGATDDVPAQTQLVTSQDGAQALQHPGLVFHEIRANVIMSSFADDAIEPHGIGFRRGELHLAYFGRDVKISPIYRPVERHQRARGISICVCRAVHAVDFISWSTLLATSL